MNVKNEVHRSLLPLMDEWSADRWDAIEADIRRRKLQVVPPKKPRLKKHLTRLLLCAVLSVAVFGMMLNLPFVSNWFATQKSVPVESKPLSQDIIVVNEVVENSVSNYIQDNLKIGYKKRLNIYGLLRYLEYDIRPLNYPNDLYFREDLFEKKPPELVYDSDGNLIFSLYSNFFFIYESKDAARRMAIYYSKISAQVSEFEYYIKEIKNVCSQSIINGVNIKIGHLSTESRFDGYTQKLPTERYVAEFTIHGINIQVTADNLMLEEFVTVIKSMIR